MYPEDDEDEYTIDTISAIVLFVLAPFGLLCLGFAVVYTALSMVGVV